MPTPFPDMPPVSHTLSMSLLPTPGLGMPVGGVPVGAIAGTMVGVMIVVVTLAVVLLVMLVLRKRLKKVCHEVNAQEKTLDNPIYTGMVFYNNENPTQ